MNRHNVFFLTWISGVVCVLAACAAPAQTTDRTSSDAGEKRTHSHAFDGFGRRGAARSNGFVLWSFGTGLRGTRADELAAPHMAEQNPTNPDEILVAEEGNHDVVLISKSTGALRVLYGRRGVPGAEDCLTMPLAAHYLPAGPYQGHVIVAEYEARHRILIIHKDAGKILWQYDNFKHPMDAIYWDDDHIMASDGDRGIFKIRLSDKAEVWDFEPKPRGNPFYLQKLNHPGVDSYGGDLLVSYYGKPRDARVVHEIRTSDKEIIWSYGLQQKHGLGDVYDQLKVPARAFRFGMQVDGNGAAFTIICDERSRILCVNKFKELVWELGGGNATSPELHAPITPYCVLPTYVTHTRAGNLLVTDWGRNMILEIDPLAIPPRLHNDAYLMKDYETTDAWEDSAVMECRGYAQKNIQVYNTHAAASARWQVLASHDATRWQVVHVPSSELAFGAAGHVTVSEPWNYIKVQVKSAISAKPAKVDVIVTMQR